jgi:Na+-translocating ferredoxin:NAD+ oxidoreductase RnfD subunit
VSSSRSVTIRGQTYPVFLPSIRDPRLHVAAVIITIHVLGQVGLGFQVSVPQILAAILASAILEVGLTFRTAKAFVWPASAMLTGSGVALILRVIGTPVNDPWSFDSVGLFAIVGGGSLLTKYVIKYRGTHVFNPSNIGLVVAFLVLGSSQVEPLDFWWAPLGLPMLVAYAVIIVGGLLITRRLKLLGLAASYWITLVIGVGILSASGHCMTASWAFAPVCGADFWRAIVTSPEVLVFLFFMITDPKTTPSGQVGRVVFGLLVGVATTLMIAPQTNEFDTKVALLSSLVVICAARPILDRLVPEPRSAADDLRAFGARLVRGAGAGAGAVRAAARVGLIAVTVLAVGVGIVAAGTPARESGSPAAAEILGRVPHQVDPSTFPTIVVQQDVADWNHELVGEGAQEVLLTLAENLELESQALLQGDPSILVAACHGARLTEMQLRVADAQANGQRVITRYRFERVEFSLREPFGVQAGLSLGVISRGTQTEETYDATGALQSSVSSPFDLTFVMARPTSYRWLTVAVEPAGPGG